MNKYEREEIDSKFITKPEYWVTRTGGPDVTVVKEELYTALKKEKRDGRGEFKQRVVGYLKIKDETLLNLLIDDILEMDIDC